MIASEKSIRIAGTAHDSIVDGPGLRMTIFFQGCGRRCPGCHNPETWPADGGRETTAAALLEEAGKNPLIDGVTFSGGEPLLRAGALIPLARGIRERGLDLAIYSGWTFEEILGDGDKDVMELLGYASVLVDGPFIENEKSMLLTFRGSRNQRILDLAKSLHENKAINVDDPSWM